MKTRTGFVSNSSSSSFIVFMPKKPKTIEEVRTILFKDKNFDDVFYHRYDDNLSTTIEEICKTILDDINKMNDTNKASDNKFLYERIVDEIRRTKSRENDIICMYDENKDILDIYNVYKKDFDSFITKYEKSMTECDRLRGEFWFRYNFLCESCVRSFNRNNGTKIKEIEDIAKIDESFYKDEMKAIGVSTSGLSKQIEKAEQDKSLKNKKLDLAIKVKKYILKLVKENNYFMFTTYYSDNNGDLGNIMEHSGIFDAVKHVTINRH